MAISTVTAGTVIDPAWGNSVAAAINAHEDAWTSFTPTPNGFTVGSGTITARYNVIGKTVFYRGEVIFAADSTLPGDLGVNLPVAASTVAPASGAVTAADAGVSYYAGGCVLTSSTSMEFYGTFGPTNGGRFNNLYPFIWAVGDAFRWSITYEAA